MDLTHWIMTISAILIFKFNRDKIATSWPPFFLWTPQEFVDISNSIVLVLDIGITWHFVLPQRTFYSKSQDKNLSHKIRKFFTIFLWLQEKILIYLLLETNVLLYIYIILYIISIYIYTIYYIIFLSLDL